MPEFLRKPREGAACNGCGLCCAAEPCGLGLELGAEDGKPCKFLEWDQGRFWCGVVRDPAKATGNAYDPLEALVVSITLLSMLGDGTCDAEGAEGMTIGEFMLSGDD